MNKWSKGDPIVYHMLWVKTDWKRDPDGNE